MYIASCLAVLGYIRNDLSSTPTSLSTSKESTCSCSTSTRVRKRRVTYCDWSDVTADHPQTFTILTPELVHLARDDGCLFLRKLKYKDMELALEHWLKFVLGEECFDIKMHIQTLHGHQEWDRKLAKQRSCNVPYTSSTNISSDSDMNLSSGNITTSTSSNLRKRVLASCSVDDREYGERYPNNHHLNEFRDKK